jgi:general secretion pathway protein A
LFLEHFGLSSDPFGVTPDPRFLYLGEQHREALASLAYGTETNRGFLALVAKPGMGKTSLLYQYMEDLRGKARTAFIFRTDCDSREFIRQVLLDFDIDAGGKDLPAMHETLNKVLAEDTRAGRRVVLIIDEAQNLEEKVLESVRLLSNFETPWTKLMQIVIAGQPSLAEKLTRPSMAQLRQRISMVIRLAPLNAAESDAYIDHRLNVAGCKDLNLFSTEARSLIAQHSGGIPRTINNICFNAMSVACALKNKTVDPASVLETVADLDLESLVEGAMPAATLHDEMRVQVSSPPPEVKEKRPWTQGGILRLAVTGALVLAVVTGVNDGKVRASDSDTAVEKLSLQQVSISEPTPPSVEVAEPSIEKRPSSVTVLAGQTLYQISVGHFGRYDQRTVAEIRKLNPWLTDPTRIRAGQQILMPQDTISRAHGKDGAAQGASSLPKKGGQE